MSGLKTFGISKGIWLLLTVVLVPATALAQIDPVERTYLEAAIASPLHTGGPVTGYGFLLWNRPHFHHRDTYARVVVAPTYVRGEWILDNWPGHGQALGLGGEGGFFSTNFYDYSDGRYLRGRSFWGHSVGAEIAYYLQPHRIAGRLPVNIAFTAAPHYLVYQGHHDLDPDFRVPADTPEYTFRTGILIGGVPPVLVPEKALEFSAWHEVRYRTNAGSYGLPGQLERTRHMTERSWFRVGGIVPVGDRQTVSLFFGMGVAERTDPLSAFRLGGLQRMRSRFPLVLHGYASDEIFARRYRLVNAYYRFPLLPHSRRVRLQLDFDYAKVDYLPGHGEPRRDLVGLGTDVIVQLSPAMALSLGLGYGVDAARGSGFGSRDASLRFQMKL
ncbi:MAG: hypothetical protein WCC36_00595 [Gammaproteobacteria bacterium]